MLRACTTLADLSISRGKTGGVADWSQLCCSLIVSADVAAADAMRRGRLGSPESRPEWSLTSEVTDKPASRLVPGNHTKFSCEMMNLYSRLVTISSPVQAAQISSTHLIKPSGRGGIADRFSPASTPCPRAIQAVLCSDGSYSAMSFTQGLTPVLRWRCGFH